jgi:hypothetical protein
MLICAAAMLAKNISTHACYQRLRMPLVNVTQQNQTMLLFFLFVLTDMSICGPAAGMARMVSDVLSVLRAPTAPPTEGTLLLMSVWNVLMGRPPCSGQAKLVPTAPLSAFVMLAMAHLRGVHRNVQSAPAPSIRVSIAPLLPPLKTPSPPVFNALTFQPGRSLVMSMAYVHSIPPGLQYTVQVPLQSHLPVAHRLSQSSSLPLDLAKSPCLKASHT